MSTHTLSKLQRRCDRLRDKLTQDMADTVLSDFGVGMPRLSPRDQLIAEQLRDAGRRLCQALASENV